MATTKTYCNFILEQINDLGDVDCRPMMGEYLLYCNHVLFGGIYDNRLLIKQTSGNRNFNLPMTIPYSGAKPMYLIEDLENRETLKLVISVTVNDLLNQKKSSSSK